MSKPLVFISYCRKDLADCDVLIQEALEPCKAMGYLDYWRDLHTDLGEEHYPEIISKLDQASATIFLVSPGFVSSWFIQNEELPRVLEARKQGRMKVFWLLLRPIDLAFIKELTKLQAVENPSLPLIKMNAAERSELWAKLSKQLREWAEQQVEPTPIIETVVPQAPAEELDLRERLRSRDTRLSEAVSITYGDLAHEAVDVAIVSASASFRALGGIEMAIHKAAGPGLKAALSGAKLGVAEARVTPAFELPARNLVHVLAPTWTENPRQDLALLHQAYNNAFDAALAAGARSIALGALATGHKGFPAEVTAGVAIEAARRAIERGPDGLTIRFVVQKKGMYDSLNEALLPMRTAPSR